VRRLASEGFGLSRHPPRAGCQNNEEREERIAQTSRPKSMRVIKSSRIAVRDGREGTGRELTLLEPKQNACQGGCRGRKEMEVLFVGIVEEA
jgi:hypothetical protein